MSRRVWFSIGSNLGDRLAYLQTAVDALSEVGPVRTSGVFETEPVGVDDQPSYLNAIIEVVSDLPPRALLGLCAEIEAAAGRVRTERWAARTLDVDIVAIEGESVSEVDLQIPHPRAHERGFVLIPLSELVSPVLVALPEPTADMRHGVLATAHVLEGGHR